MFISLSEFPGEVNGWKQREKMAELDKDMEERTLRRRIPWTKNKTAPSKGLKKLREISEEEILEDEGSNSEDIPVNDLPATSKVPLQKKKTVLTLKQNAPPVRSHTASPQPQSSILGFSFNNNGPGSMNNRNVIYNSNVLDVGNIYKSTISDVEDLQANPRSLKKYQIDEPRHTPFPAKLPQHMETRMRSDLHDFKTFVISDIPEIPPEPLCHEISLYPLSYFEDIPEVVPNPVVHDIDLFSVEHLTGGIPDTTESGEIDLELHAVSTQDGSLD